MFVQVYLSSIDSAKDSFYADELIDGTGICLNYDFLACFWDLRITC